MAEILLQTKLFVPPIRPSLVPRPHLIEKLNQGLQTGGKLTLISAPAGFGKTTLVSEWIAGGKRPFAWLSLDEGDSDLTRFLTYLMAALQTLRPSLGKKALEMLKSPEPPPTELCPLLKGTMGISTANYRFAGVPKLWPAPASWVCWSPEDNEVIWSMNPSLLCRSTFI